MGIRTELAHDLRTNELLDAFTFLHLGYVVILDRSDEIDASTQTLDKHFLVVRDSAIFVDEAVSPKIIFVERDGTGAVVVP